MSSFQDKVQSEWEKYQRNRKNELYPNIMLLGASGVGKSSLINTVFGGQFAPVSDVEPETKGYCTVYKGRQYGSTVNLIDTAGYELGKGDSYYNAIHQVISCGIGEEGPVHIIWYCISVTNERVQEMDFDVLRRLMGEPDIRKRVCIVFTKCDEDSDDGFKAAALRSALAENIGFSVPTFETSKVSGCELQLPELIQWSADAIDDEDLRKNFVAAQMSDLEAKRKTAAQIIAVSATAAAGIGATPIPFSDAVLLVPVQVGMMGKIIDVYGISSLARISTALVSDVVISQLGKSMVSGLLKMIPVVGSVVGGIVNAGVASTLTGAMGFAASEICYQNLKKALSGQQVFWDDLFTSDDFINLTKEAMKGHKK